VFHEKADGISTSSATETFVNLFRRGNRKRGRFFIVKRAQAQIIGSPFFQFDETANDIDDIDAGLNLRYGFLTDQAVKLSKPRRGKKNTFSLLSILKKAE
jgi:hypothetical protein